MSVPDDPRIHRSRVRLLAKSLGVEPTSDEAARCTTADAAAEVFVARLGAVASAAGDTGALRHAALCSLREAIHEVCRVDRADVENETLLAGVVARPRGRRWQRLAKEIGCKLPPLEASWTTVALVGAGVGAVLAIRTAAGTAVSFDEFVALHLVAAVVSLAVLLVGFEFADFPGGIREVRPLVNWLVAMRPAALRGGTGWTTAQVAEVADAVWRLRWKSPGLRVFLSAAMLGALLAIWLLALAVLSLLDALIPALS